MLKILVVAAAACAALAQVPPTAYVNFEGAQTNPIRLSADGKFLYASNRGDENNIAIFSVNPQTGMLTAAGYQSCGGATPRNFIIDPTGNYLLVANQNTSDIFVYLIDKATGKLVITNNRILVGNPSCLKFTPAE